MNLQKTTMSLALFLFSVNQITMAQGGYTINKSNSNDMKLSGTSTLHDWDMTAHEFTGKAHFDFKKGDDQTIVGLNALSFSLPVTNLKSDKKELDKNAYKALNTSIHKNINYKLISAKVSPEKDHKFLINTKGHLTISGNTRVVMMNVTCEVNKDETINCKGSEALKMSDYKVEPPSFMWGVMKTGDDLKLEFTMVYKK